MYRNDALVVFDILYIVILKFDFEKGAFFNKVLFLHGAFYRDFWEGITTFLSTSIILDGSPN